MRDTYLRDHLTIVAQLPDFVLGQLDETSMRRVARHLETCSTCRREWANAMNVLGLLAAEPPPPRWLRDAILDRAAAESREAIGPCAAAGSAIVDLLATSEVGSKPVTVDDCRWRMPFGQPVPRWALVAASAAVFLVSMLAGWSYDQGNSVFPNDRIHALVNYPAAAYPLDDSDLPVAATGVVFAEPKGREVYLVANGLPVLPENQRYQVWLFTTDDKLQTAGLLTGGADGNLRALLQTPAPFAEYVGVGLTAEPQMGSTTPTSDLVLGGSFPPQIALLPPLTA